MQTKRLKGPKFQVLESPFSGIPRDKRRERMAQLRVTGNQKVSDAIEKIESIFQKYDPLQLLSMLSSYELTVGVSGGGISQFNRNGDQITQPYVEFCQALALRQDYSSSSLSPAGPGQYQELRDSIIQIKNSMPFMDFDEAILDLEEQEMAIKTVQKKVRDHTFLIRNWGHFGQVEKISRELFSTIDPALTQAIGFNANQTISLFKGMTRVFEEASTLRRNKLAELIKTKSSEEIVYKYHKQVGESEEQALQFIEKFNVKKQSKQNLIAMMMSHQDLFLSDDFTFTPSGLSKVVNLSEEIIRKILNFLSIEFGDLKSIDTSDLFLENPVHTKIVIKTGSDEYFCPLPHIFFSFIFPTLDTLIELSGIKSLPSRRSEFLEDQVENIVKTRFPASSTVKNVTWKYEGRTYETDLITVIDSYAIIFEAKSGRITPSALRGGPARIKKHLEEILIAPNIQSRRLSEKLHSILSGETDIDLERQLPEQFRKVKKIIRVSVSLEHFSVIQSHLWSLKNTGWLPEDFKPCPAISIGDFESIFEILEHPIQIIHYLERRAELEVELHYLGDEMDLLGLYLDTLFDLKIPSDGKNILNIYGMSKSIDDYYNLTNVGVKVARPKVNISKYWNDVLQQLEDRQVERWTELGSLLLRFSPKDQKKMIKLAKSKERYIHKNWQNEDHENIFIYAPPAPSDVVLAIFLFKNENMNRRHEYLDAALAHGLGLDGSRIKYCIAIGRNIDRSDMAYHLISLGE